MAAPMRIAVLDDYQNVALQMADWSAVTDRADVTVFNDHRRSRRGWSPGWNHSTSSS